MIKNIILDIGNVLISFRYIDYMKEDLHFDDKTVEALCNRMMSSLWHELDLGVREEKEVIKEMIDGLPEYKEEFKLFFDNITKVVAQYDYAEEWIKDLHDRGYKVYLLSNYPRELFKLHEKAQFSFTDKVDGMVVSGFIQKTKPDKDIYDYLIDKYNLKKEECIFFDDTQINVDGGNNAGIKSYLFTNYEDAKKIIDGLN